MPQKMSPPSAIARRYNQLELITEHLGYLPVRFTDDFYNACIGCMAKAVEGVEAFVNTLPGDEKKKIEVGLTNSLTPSHWQILLMQYVFGTAGSGKV
jgi:hypothetical protein